MSMSITKMTLGGPLKVVVQPAANEDLYGVVFSLSNPNVSSHVTGQMCTLEFFANH